MKIKEIKRTILKVSEINQYINDLTKRKILFSKYKIKNIEDKSPMRKQFYFWDMLLID